MAARINVLVIEQDSSYQAALKAIISTEGDMECVGAYSSLRNALAELPLSKADVVLLGLSERKGRPANLVRQVVQSCREAAVIVIGRSDDHRTILECLSSGALGYLLRVNSWAVVCQAIREVHQGGSPFSPEIAAKVVKLFQSMAEPVKAGTLTHREREIVHFLDKRARNKDIAKALNLSVSTVRAHLQRIYLKLRVGSRGEAIRKLSQTPLLSAPG